MNFGKPELELTRNFGAGFRGDDNPELKARLGGAGDRYSMSLPAVKGQSMERISKH